MQTRAAIDSSPIRFKLSLTLLWRRGRDSTPRTPFGVLLTFQASAFDHSATSPRGRKGTGGDPSDQIYGGAEPEGSWTGGTEGWAGAGGAVRISLAALLGGAGL